jgi:hypothetical protein
MPAVVLLVLLGC